LKDIYKRKLNEHKLMFEERRASKPKHQNPNVQKVKHE
jgi:hypothetical protein